VIVSPAGWLALAQASAALALVLLGLWVYLVVARRRP
jgi:hypothetical protein